MVICKSELRMKPSIFITLGQSHCVPSLLTASTIILALTTLASLRMQVVKAGAIPKLVKGAG
jgi:hypothetical protein